MMIRTPTGTTIATARSFHPVNPKDHVREGMLSEVRSKKGTLVGTRVSEVERNNDLSVEIRGYCSDFCAFIVYLRCDFVK